MTRTRNVIEQHVAYIAKLKENKTKDQKEIEKIDRKFYRDIKKEIMSSSYKKGQVNEYGQPKPGINATNAQVRLNLLRRPKAVFEAFMSIIRGEGAPTYDSKGISRIPIP